MIKLVWGSDTGNTEEVVGILEREFDLIDETIAVSEMDKEQWSTHNVYMLGIPTWYDGELQSDWEDYFEDFKQIDFTGKHVCIFGLGDQEGYDEYFVDGIGILAQVVEDNGGTIIGKTSTEGYDYTESKAEVDGDKFYGLALDEDNQDDLTEERISNWIEQLRNEISETI